MAVPVSTRRDQLLNKSSERRRRFIEHFEKLYGRKPTFGMETNWPSERVARDMLISRRTAEFCIRQAISADFLTKTDSSVPWVH
jgi:hypothetical protein